MFQKKISDEYIKNYVNFRYENISKSEEEISPFINSKELELKNKTILDLASGPGTYEIIFSKKAPKEIICIDTCKEYLDLAKKKHKELIPKTKIKYYLKDLMFIKKLEENKFDFVYCNSLYYVKSLDEFFSNLSKIIKPDGKILIEFRTMKHFKEETLFTKISSVALYLINKIFFKKLFPTTFLPNKELYKNLENNNFKKVKSVIKKNGVKQLLLINKK